MYCSKVKFVLFSSVILFAVAASVCISELRREQRQLEEVIDSINFHFVGEEQIAAEHDGDLSDNLSDRLVEVKLYLENVEQLMENVEERNRKLEEVVSARYNTYQTAVNLEGAEAPVVSASGFTAEMIDRAWKNLGAPKMIGTGSSFVNAEKEYGVNALVIASIAAHESGFGRSEIARDKNNLFGFGAHYYAPYRSAHTFESIEAGTSYISSFIRSQYLSREGRYYNGNTLRSMNVHYASDRDWADKVAGVMSLIARAAVDEGEVELWEQLLNSS